MGLSPPLKNGGNHMPLTSVTLTIPPLTTDPNDHPIRVSIRTDVGAGGRTRFPWKLEEVFPGRSCAIFEESDEEDLIGPREPNVPIEYLALFVIRFSVLQLWETHVDHAADRNVTGLNVWQLSRIARYASTCRTIRDDVDRLRLDEALSPLDVVAAATLVHGLEWAPDHITTSARTVGRAREILAQHGAFSA